MKTLHFIRANRTRHGGAEVYLSRLSEALKRKGVVHTVRYSTLPKWLPSWLRVWLFDRQVCGEKKADDLYFSLERISCPDIYRAGDGVHRVFVKVEKKSLFNPLHHVYMWLEERCFGHAKKIIANSHMIKKQIMETYGIGEEKIVVVHNGVSVEAVDEDDAKRRISDEFGVDFAQHKMLLYVGSGFRRKGVEELLHLLAALKEEPYIALIVGKEKKMAHYRAVAEALGLGKRVLFTGARDDVKYFYAASDLFIFPTRYEPFSNVVLEAMAYGNAVVTTRQNGASEILDATFVMESASDRKIVPVLKRLLQDETYLASVKDANRQTASKFSIEKNVEETLKVIDEVSD